MSRGHNSSGVFPPLVVHHFQGCVDLRGQAIPHGLLFAPGPDECQICTCVNGAAGFCRTVLCAPPHNCQSLRVGDQCCQWICLDDVRPGDSFFGIGSSGGNDKDDARPRLAASAFVVLFALALILYLIYR
jgi:hypothetical protein